VPNIIHPKRKPLIEVLEFPGLPSSQVIDGEENTSFKPKNTVIQQALFSPWDFQK